MTRNLRSLGLATAVVAVAIAAAAPAAQAAQGQLTATAYPALLTGTPIGGLQLDVGEEPERGIGCMTANFEGTLTMAANEVNLKPKFTGCTAGPGATPATVTTNGCSFRFAFGKPGTTGEVGATGKISVGITCPGKGIEVHIYANGILHGANEPMCTYHIEPTGLRAAGIYHNLTPGGAPKDVSLTVGTGFTSEATDPGLVGTCGGEPVTNHLPARLTGNYTLRAYQDNAGIEGAQMHLDVG